MMRDKWLRAAAGSWEGGKEAALMRQFERAPKLTLESNRVTIGIVRQGVEGTRRGGLRMAAPAEGSPDLAALQPANMTLDGG